MIWKELMSEHIQGKTVAESHISEDRVELIFTDGSEINIYLQYVGYAGAKLENMFYPPEDPIKY